MPKVMPSGAGWKISLCSLLASSSIGCAGLPVQPPPCPRPEVPTQDMLTPPPPAGYFLQHQDQLLKAAGFPTPAPDYDKMPSPAN